MIISTKKGTPKEELEKIVDKFEKQGLDVTLITGKDYNVFGLVGDTTKIDERDVLANPWIDNVTRVSAPYKRANRLFHPADSVIDCGGVKQVICDALFPVSQRYAWHFIGGHPMAGREYSGFKYARDDLFDHASMILCGHGDDDPAVLQRARDFFMELGFLRVQFTTPKTHDEMIAYTSQLAHVVSSAYVKCPLADKHRGFSAGSFADMTRVARLNEDMWTELFFDNREALLPVVEDLVQRVTEYRDALRDENREEMRKLLREGRETKERLTE